MVDMAFTRERPTQTNSTVQSAYYTAYWRYGQRFTKTHLIRRDPPETLSRTLCGETITGYWQTDSAGTASHRLCKRCANLAGVQIMTPAMLCVLREWVRLVGTTDYQDYAHAVFTERSGRGTSNRKACRALLAAGYMEPDPADVAAMPEHLREHVGRTVIPFHMRPSEKGLTVLGMTR